MSTVDLASWLRWSRSAYRFAAIYLGREAQLPVGLSRRNLGFKLQCLGTDSSEFIPE